MKIPKKFQLFGETITVKFDKDIANAQDKIGASHLRQGKITLHKPDDVYSEDRIEQTFHHELVHFILDRISEPKLCHSEAFVDRFANLLHQATKTMEY